MAACDEKLPIWQDWTLVEKLGQGANGRAYKAERNNFGVVQQSAIKVISIPQDEREIMEDSNGEPDRSYYQSVVESKLREIKLMISLQGNTNIVSIQDSQVVERQGSFGWDIYIRMELLTCLTKFTKAYTKGRFLSERQVIKLGRDICRALTYCEKRKIVHRDIKPANIFVNEEDDDYKLGDFGEARRFLGGDDFTLRGTPNYIAPELANITAAGASSELVAQTAGTVDTYSLGITMYELLNFGRLPFMPDYPTSCNCFDNDRAFTRRMQGEPLPPPRCHSQALAQAVLKACSYQSDQRYVSAAAFDDALAAITDAQSEPPEPPVIPAEPETEPEATAFSATLPLPAAQPQTPRGEDNSGDATIVLQSAPPLTATLSASLSIGSKSGYHFRLLPDGSLELTGYEGSARQLSLPDQIGGHPVTAIASRAFQNNELIETLTTRDGLRSIGPLAFARCGSLRQVFLADGLLEIGSGAFFACPQLSECRLPNGLTAIGSQAFADCGSLEKIGFPGSLRQLGSQAFANCAALSSAYLPRDLQELGAGVFEGCLKLDSARTPGLSTGLFRDCAALRNLAVGDSLDSPGYCALSGCGKLEKLSLPERWRQLDAAALAQLCALEPQAAARIQGIS